MQPSVAIEELTQAQRDLWHRVEQLWAQSRGRDPVLIGQALHPRYVGWDMSADRPHNRDAAIASVMGRWTEVYLRQVDRWPMIAVSGRPDSPLDRPNVQSAGDGR